MKLKQLQRFAAGFRKGILGKRSSAGWCFAICSPLQALMELNGIECELVELKLEWCNHFVLQLPCGNIIDPTADQFDFGLPPVYVGPMPDEYKPGARTATDTTACLSESAWKRHDEIVAQVADMRERGIV